MWKILKSSHVFLLLCALCAFLDSWRTILALSDQRLCADEKCQEIISLGKGKITYHAGEEGMVSFKINTPIRIKSKSAGSDPNLWGIEVNGREGYAPKDLIQETRILKSEKSLTHIVPVTPPGRVLPSPSLPQVTPTPVPVSQPQMEATILNTSESTEVIADTTTTAPLKTAENKGEGIVVNARSESPVLEQPAEVTSVQMEIIDGTQVPILSELTSNGAMGDKDDAVVTTVGDNEDEFGDYEVYEEDGDIGVKIEKEPSQNSSSLNEKTEEGPSGSKSSEEKLSSKKEEQTGTSQHEKTAQVNEPMHSENTTSASGVGENPVESVSALSAELGNHNDTSYHEKPEEVTNMGDTVTNINNVDESKMSNQVPLSLETKASSSLPDEIVKKSKSPESSEFNTESLMDNTSQNINVSNHSAEGVNETASTLDSSNTISEEIESETNVREAPQYEEPPNVVTNVQLNTPKLNSQFESATTNNNVEVKTLENMKETAEVKYESDTERASNAHQTGSKAASVTVNQPETKTESNEATRVHQPSVYKTDGTAEGFAKSAVDFHPIDGLSGSSAETTAASSGVDQSNQSDTTTENVSSQPDTTTENVLRETIESHQPDASTVNNAERSFGVHKSDASTESITDEVTSVHQTDTKTETHEEETRGVHHPDDIKNGARQPETITGSVTEGTISVHQPVTRTESISESITPANAAKVNADIPESHYNDPKYNGYHTSMPSAEGLYHTQYGQEITTPAPSYDFYDKPPKAAENEAGVTKNPNVQSQIDRSSEESVDTLPTTPVPTHSTPDSLELSSKKPFVEAALDSREKGLFTTILGAVNSFLSSGRKAHNSKSGADADTIEKKLVFHGAESEKSTIGVDISDQYCEKLTSDECPHHQSEQQQLHLTNECQCDTRDNSFIAGLPLDKVVEMLGEKAVEMSELLACLSIAGAASLFFLFGYYCFCNSSREGGLLLKLNQLERSLLASNKESSILKHDLLCTRQKLASIEDNSFGSNDMVVSLKKELEAEIVEKARLQEQVNSLEKELENATEAGLELNKIVSELLNNQSGDESIISSVEELQKQLNEQQSTIMDINASLAEKSRENSELQLLIAEQNARYEAEIAVLQRDNDELETEKGNLQSRMEEMKIEFEQDVTKALEGKNYEIKRLQNEILELNAKLEAEHTKWQTSLAKVEALEECLQNVKRDPGVKINEIIDVAHVRAELLDMQKKQLTLKERLDMEIDARKLAESQLQIASAEVEKLKHNFHQSEKDKLEAQTRLEVLSNYFKDKESQLQKELSLKEAMWLKQQGEKTSTVDRLTAMQEEIQSLKSQNDALRAEIEAQEAAHKAQTGTLENRAHETWLAARQSDRRYEEARAEATALRRKLTALAGSTANETNRAPIGNPVRDELNNAPSPIHMESPGSPLLGRLPPPPFLPPPFMGPPPPFMGMPPPPPPPFVGPGEMRPAPLGRIMSPPPPPRSGRFSPQHLDYEDYLDYETNNSWHRDTYSPPRTYRSLSPTDSRYNYNSERGLISTYDTETDFSPPPSPREIRRGRTGGNGGALGAGGGGGGVSRSGNYKVYPSVSSPIGENSSMKSSSTNKGLVSSGSEKSYNSSHHGKAKGGGGKTIV